MRASVHSGRIASADRVAAELPCITTHRAPGWTVGIALELGRVSNLPTVWTNALAAAVLSAGTLTLDVMGLLLLAMSLAYTGGMYLNDAFDRHIDAFERPERPIPSGLVSARDVFCAGFAMLASSVVLTGIAAYSAGQVVPAMLVSLSLSASIVLYNYWHKGNPISPLLMGLCRLLVYITCAVAMTNHVPSILFVAAMMSFAYLIGLTFTAKQEKLGRIDTLWPLLFLIAPALFGVYYAQSSLITTVLIALFSVWTLYCLGLIFRRDPGDIPRAVVRLIAGISLVDALLIASATTRNWQDVQIDATGGLMIVLCLAAFGMTLFLQRFVSGT